MTPDVVVFGWDVSTVAGYHKVRIAVPQLVGYYLRRISISEGLNRVGMTPVVEGSCWQTELVTCSFMRSEGR